MVSGTVITIICVLAGLITSTLTAKGIIRRKEKSHQLNANLSYISEFSVSKYYERMEKASAEILRVRKKSAAYRITLWFGLDGLRLNDDGTTEWIRREKEKPKPVSILHPPPQHINFSIMQSPQHAMQALCNSVCQTPESQILALQFQLQNFCVQQIISEQNKQIMNALNSPIPYYISTCFYNTPFNHYYRS